MADEYIRKQDAVDAVEYANGNLTWAERDDCKKRLEELSPADVVQVVHAYWIDTDNYYRRWRCSACSGHTKEAHPLFCPFCGAKMDAHGEE